MHKYKYNLKNVSVEEVKFKNLVEMRWEVNPH